jgi:FkbM family methyltransferase
MSKVCKTLLASVALSLLAEQAAGDAEISQEVAPEIGWDRYSGDAARSVNGWVKWWTYLRMKPSESFLIKWIGDLVVVIHPKNEVYRALFARGVYDPNLVVLVNAMLPKGGVFIDAGANMGYVSLPASQKVGKNGRVFALEPSSRDFSRLLENVSANNLGNIIHPHRLAVSDENGSANMAIADEERSCLNTLGAEISFKGVQKIRTEEVDASTIDAFAQKEKINRIDVLKLDVEGGEVKALKGAKGVVGKYRPAIILGVNGGALKSCGTDCIELQKIIDEMGYRVYKIVERPVLSLERVENILDVASGIVVCLHESATPPVLPQPQERSFSECVSDFILR